MIIQVSSMMRLSLSLRCLTEIHINIAKPQAWRWYYSLSVCHWSLAKRLDDFADTVRLGIRNFSFPGDKEPSFRTLPVIKVEARLRNKSVTRPGYITVGLNSHGPS